MLPPGVHTCVLSLCRGRFRMKEREEMWQKIEELARLNPQVCSSRTWDKMEKNVLGRRGGGLGLLPHLMRAGCSTWCQSCAHSCSVGLSLSGCVSPVWTSAALTSRLCWSGCVYSWTPLLVVATCAVCCGSLRCYRQKWMRENAPFLTAYAVTFESTGEGDWKKCAMLC